MGTEAIIEEHLPAGEDLILCIDANAAPGPCDGQCVFSNSFRSSSGTPMLRTFLEGQKLVYPLQEMFMKAVLPPGLHLSMNHTPLTMWPFPSRGIHLAGYLQFWRILI